MERARPLIAGVDEAGRGALAGPVVAACVLLDLSQPIEGLADSKTLSAPDRARLARDIHRRALAVSIGIGNIKEIEELNILGATLLAMKRAALALVPVPDRLLIDGNHCPILEIPTRAIVRGDAKVPAIGAASIIAKTTRDSMMLDLHRRFPAYGFDHHKGYGTATHLQALERHGATEVHRRDFRPVREIIEGAQGKPRRQQQLLDALE